VSPQRIGGFQIRHITVMQSAFALRKATGKLCDRSLLEQRMAVRLK
jgi:hypothetical protein